MANKEDRIKFLENLFSDSNEYARTHNLTTDEGRAAYESEFPLEYWQGKVLEMAAAAELGRSERWKSACEWAHWQTEDETPTVALYRWAAFQGSVYMGHAIGA